MQITTADVEAAMRLLLGRDAVDPRELEAIAALCPDRASLCRHLLTSEEFERLHPDLAHASSPAPVIVPLEDGARMVVDLADAAIGVPIAHRAFERNELDFVRRTVQPGWHVVDGGAHAGLYTLTMARRVGPGGTVHAFEPVEEHVRWLEQGIRESAVGHVVRVSRAALSASNGSADLAHAQATGSKGAARLLGHGETRPASWHVQRIQTVALDEMDLPRPVSFLRLDIEGAEGLALSGASKLLEADRPVVLVEMHGDLLPRVSGQTTAAVADWMRALGYTPHGIGAGSIGAPVTHCAAHGVETLVFLP